MAAQSDSTVSSALGGATVYFASAVDRDMFGCSICLSVADEPVTCGRAEGCAAQFCGGCLDGTLQIKKQCPSCSHPIAGMPIKSLQLKNGIQKLEVLCLHRDKDKPAAAAGADGGDESKKRKAAALDPAVCEWRGKYSELATHLGKDCPGVEVGCANAGCSAKVPRCRLEEHGAECGFRGESCEHCGVLVARSAMANHVSTDCQRAPVLCDCGSSVPRAGLADHEASCPEVFCPCEYAALGCTSMVKRKDLPQHMDSAAKAHNSLLLKVTTKHQQELLQLQRELATQRRINNMHCSDIVGLRKTVEDQQQKLSTLQSMTLTWKVEGMAAKMLAARDGMKDFWSSPFFVPELGGGVSKMCLHMDLTGTKLGLYFRKYSEDEGSSSDCDVDISGWQLTLSGAGAQAQETGMIEQGVKCASGMALGWNFAEDVTPFIANDAITITAKVQVNGQAAPLVLATR